MQGKLPMRDGDKAVDWDAVTKKLCYMNKQLQETRANA